MISSNIIQIAKMRIIVPANQQETIGMAGEFLFVESANQEFAFRTNVGHKAPLKSGARVRFPDDFSSIDFINEEVTDLEAVLVYGSGNYEDDSFTGAVSVTGSVNVSGVDPFTGLNTPAQVAMTGISQVAIAANPLRKRLVLVADPANVNPIWLGGVAAQGIQLGANEPWEEYYNGAVSVIGTAGDFLQILEVT